MESEKMTGKEVVRFHKHLLAFLVRGKISRAFGTNSDSVETISGNIRKMTSPNVSHRNVSPIAAHKNDSRLRCLY